MSERAGAGRRTVRDMSSIDRGAPEDQPTVWDEIGTGTDSGDDEVGVMEEESDFSEDAELGGP